jgi:hypothetical protein
MDIGSFHWTQNERYLTKDTTRKKERKTKKEGSTSAIEVIAYNLGKLMPRP